MSKYQPLWEHLKADGRSVITMSFAEIQAVLGFPVDHAFLTCKKESAGYGYLTVKISMKEQEILFRKMN